MSYELTKVKELPEDLVDAEPKFERKLEFYDPRKNHNKFWHIKVIDRYVVRHWGRHGSKGQRSVHRAWNSWGAEEAARDLVSQKRGKGYVDDNTTVLDRFAREVK